MHDGGVAALSAGLLGVFVLLWLVLPQYARWRFGRRRR
jgi:hypothetical protein